MAMVQSLNRELNTENTILHLQFNDNEQLTMLATLQLPYKCMSHRTIIGGVTH